MHSLDRINEELTNLYANKLSDLNKLYASTDSAFEAKSLMAFITAVLRAEIDKIIAEIEGEA